MSNTFKTAQDVMSPHASAVALSGFNRRVYGYSRTDAFYHEAERTDRELYAGWDLADKMIEAGKLFFYNTKFHDTHECKNGCAFHYGGVVVCNTCNRERLTKDWWLIKVYKDGDAWCCIGSGFEDLQASNNYAFGKTREEAIKNYGDLMIKQEKQIEAIKEEERHEEAMAKA